MKNFPKGKSQKIKKAHYLTSVAAFVVAFGILGVVLEFSSYATTATNAIVGINGMCLDDAGGLAKDGNKIDLWACLNNNAQSWTITASGAIVNANGYCLDLAGGNTSAGTSVILNQCDGLITQQWNYNPSNGEIANKASRSCLDDAHATATEGNLIDIWPCQAVPTQQWNYKAITSSNTKTSSPGSPSIAVTDTYTPPASAPKLNQSNAAGVSSSTATTRLNQTQGTTTGNSISTTDAASNQAEAPTMSDISISKVTANSATLTWQGNTSSTHYTVKYGSNPNSLTHSASFNAAGPTVQVVLHKLPSGQNIYVAVTPSVGENTGAIKNVALKTNTNVFWIPLLILLLVILGILAMLIKIIGKKPVAPDHTSRELPLPETPPVVPHEDVSAYNERKNWWLPQKYRQTGLPRRDVNAEFPDMFTEGQKRLAEEEKAHKLPKE